MDKNFEAYLKSLDFDDEDIENFCILVPSLEDIELDQALACIDEVVKAGYPKDDIDSLIFSNPGFLVCDPEYIKNKLASLGGDVEAKLKEDPTLI